MDCRRNIEMTPLCKIEVTHPGDLESREVRLYDGDDAEEPIKCSQGTCRTEEAAEASPPDRRCYAVVIALRKKAAAV